MRPARFIDVASSRHAQVVRWLIIQLTLTISFASAIYTFQGSPSVTATGVFPEACELVTVSDFQSPTYQGALRTWARTYELLSEAVMSGDPHFEVLAPHMTPICCPLRVMPHILDLLIVCNRLACLWQCIRRYSAYRMPRPDSNLHSRPATCAP